MHAVLTDASDPDGRPGRPRWRDRAARVPAAAWFLASGAAAALVVRIHGSSLPAHLGFLAAAAALLAAGGWIERVVFRIDGKAPPAPAHQIVLGQAAFLVYFYARSALSHGFRIPGVGTWELYAVGAAAAIDLLRRRRRSGTESAAPGAAHVVVWLLWWASSFTYLGYRSGRLEPPASDPDFHALLARLTAEHGRIVYDLLPTLAQPSAYPSAFSALNAIWIELSGATPVAVVNCQIALQACLAVGLVLEMAFAMRARALGVSLLLLALAHFVFSFPVNAMMAYFEGTPRLAHKALALLPLTAAVRLSTAEGAARGRAAWSIGAFCLAAAAAINPTHVFVEVPILLAAGLLVGRDLLRAWRAAVAAAALAALLIASDAWYAPQLRALVGGRPSAPRLSLSWTEALRAGFDSAGSVALAHALPYRCIPSAQCPRFVLQLAAVVVLPLVALALFTAFAPRAPAGPRRSAWVVLCVALALWGSAFLAGFAPALFSRAAGLNGSLLQSYSQNGLTFSTSLLLFVLLGAALAFAAALAEWLLARRRPVPSSIADLAVSAAAALACAAVLVVQPGLRGELSTAFALNVHAAPMTALGRIEPDDVRVARAAAEIVAPHEKVLLPGLVARMNQWETWYFALGGGRAIPLYTGVPVAFFHSGADGSSTAEYRDHVCDRLDLSWLAERGIVWFYESTAVASWACVHAWPEARDRYFDLRLRGRTASLWRLRTDLLAGAKRDALPSR